MSLLRTRSALFALLLSSACGSVVSEPAPPPVYYPAPPEPPRIQFLRHVSLGSDIEKARTGLDKLLFGEVEIEKGVLAPYGAEVRDGITYICDIQQGVILTLDLKEGVMDFLRLEGRAALQKPTNLDFGPEGRLYVADIGRRQVVVYDRNLNMVRELGPWGEESRVVDVEVAGGRLYLVDAGTRQIRVLDAETFEELQVFGADSTAGPVHRAPTNIAVDEDGTCYVVDTIGCQIFVWDADGVFVRHISQPGDVIGDLARPKGIALDDGKLFVIDAAIENCQIFSLEGEPLMFFGNPGVDPGNLYLPAAVWIGTDGLEVFEDLYADGFRPEKLIVITNLYGPHKVNFYALGKAEGFIYPEDEAALGVTNP